MYKVIRPLFFLFSPERAHNIVATLVRTVYAIAPFRWIMAKLYCVEESSLERELFGLKFKNPVGLAAGFDKESDLYNPLFSLGFGFIEIGSITPTPQPGNPKPRLFRLPKDEAIINRMGINNSGVYSAIENLKKRPPKGVVGANIIKATVTPNSEAVTDYETLFLELYPYVDYFAINLSCPNVKDLRQLQEVDSVTEIVERLTQLREEKSIYRPILLKLSPDLDEPTLSLILQLVREKGIDGVIATNTTTTRDNLTTSKDEVEAIGEGGLSGKPLFEKSLERVKFIHKESGGEIPIIAVGGIMTPQQAKEMLDGGASLIQIYTGFIYKGPRFVKSILKYLIKSN